MSAHGGVVLAGGRSSRMGRPKATLDWHGSPLLRRVCGLLSRAVDGPLVVVRAPGQELPVLPAAVRVVEDPVPGEGPLRGIATGLEALDGAVERAVVTALDLPLLDPAVLRRLTTLPGRVVLPVVDGRPQVLAAVYALALLPAAYALLEADQRRPILLADAATRVELPSGSFAGANTVEQYAALLSGPAPSVVVERFGVLARGGSGAAAVSVPAWTVGEAAAAVGLVLDRHLLAAVNGESTVRDPLTPLVDGDTVALLSADAGG